MIEHAAFEINDQNQIVVRDGADIDFETQNVYGLSVRVTDPEGGQLTQLVTVNVNNLAEDPSNITFPVSTIDENTTANTIVGRIGVEDDSDRGQLSFSLEGENADDFFVLGGNILVRPGADLNFEADQELDLTIVVTDPDGGVGRQDITLNVNDLNEGPSNLAITPGTVDENSEGGTFVGDLTVSDPDFNENHTFEIVDFSGNVVESEFFEINEDNQLVIRDGAVIDFEQHDTLFVNIKATDQGGLTTQTRVSVAVNDIDEGTTGGVDVGGGDEVNFVPFTQINENLEALAENSVGGTVVANLVAIDENEGDTHTFDIIGNTNDVIESSFFEINDENQLVVREDAVIDFEQHETLFVNVRVTDQDGAYSFERVSVPIEDLDESQAPTDITFSDLSVDENSVPGTVVATLGAIDPDAGDTHTFELSGEGAEFFEIDGNLIVVRDGVDLDTETLAEIPLTVTATDSSGNTFSEDTIIDVANVNEAPTTITPSTASVDENSFGNTAVATLQTDNPEDSEHVSFEIVGGSDDFFILGNTIRVKPGSELDHEDSDSATLVIRATDSGGNSVDSEISIAINDVNEAPTAIVGSPTSVDENAEGGTVLANFSPVDADEGDTFTFDIVRFNGEIDDNPFIEIDENGVLTVREGADINFEQHEQLGFNLRITDSEGLSITQRFTIDVNDLDENPAPTDITFDNTSIDENSAAGVTVANLGATDANQSTGHTFEISGPGADVLEVVGDRLVVKEGAEIDFETTSEFSLTVTTTDAGGKQFTEEVTFTVNDLNEGPTDLVVSQDNSVAENTAPGAVVATLAATDADGDALTYTLSGEGSENFTVCLLYTSPSPRDLSTSRMPSSA